MKKASDIKITVDPRLLAHCMYCTEPLYCIYDQTKKRLCYECRKEISLENAKEILGKPKKPKDKK